jgi:hypothetical protein
LGDSWVGCSVVLGKLQALNIRTANIRTRANGLIGLNMVFYSLISMSGMLILVSGALTALVAWQEAFSYF